MSTFAIYYNLEDFSTLAGSVTNPGLTGADRALAAKFWNGGLKDWASAPLAKSKCDDPNLPSDARRCIINGGNNNMADLVALGRRIADALLGGNQPGQGGYLYALCADIESCGDDPYPPV